jgi:hypothetical protein
VARSLLHACEEVPVMSLDWAALAADPNARSPVESLAGRIAEARRSAPSILYLPAADAWWGLADDGLRSALVSLVEAIPSDLPVLLLATLSSPHAAAAVAAAAAAAAVSSSAAGAGAGGKGAGAATAAGAPLGGLPSWAADTSHLFPSLAASAAAQKARAASPVGALSAALPKGLGRLLFGSHPLPAVAAATAGSSGVDAQLAAAGVLALRPFTAPERRAFFEPLWASLLPKPAHLRGVLHDATGAASSAASGLAAAAEALLVDGVGDDGAGAGAGNADDDAAGGALLTAALDVARRRTERRERKVARNSLELEVAPPPPPPAPPSAAELAAMRRALAAKEDKYLKSLRIGLRSVLDDLARDPKYRAFAVPVDPADVGDYYRIVVLPMDLQTMSDKVEAGAYVCYDDFAGDLRLIWENCREYNPANDADPRGRRLVRNAHAMGDFADIVIRDYDRRVGGKLLAKCAAIKARRARDGELPCVRPFLAWGYPSTVSAQAVANEAQMVARAVRAYGAAAVGPDATSAVVLAAGASQAAVAAAAAALAAAASSSSAAAAAAAAEALRPTRRSSRGAGAGAADAELLVLPDRAAGRKRKQPEPGDSAAGSVVAVDDDDDDGEGERQLGDDEEVVDVSGSSSSAAAAAAADGGGSSSSAAAAAPVDGEGEPPAKAPRLDAADGDSEAASSSSSSSAAAAPAAADAAADGGDVTMVANTTSALSSAAGDNDDGEAAAAAASSSSAVARKGSSYSASSSSGAASKAAAAVEAAAAAAARIEAAMNDELAAMQAAGAEYRALAPRSAALLGRLVAATAGWDLGQLERARAGLAAQADAFAAALRAARKARVAATTAAAGGGGSAGAGAGSSSAAAALASLPELPPRSSLLDVVEAHVAAWEGAAGGSSSY